LVTNIHPPLQANKLGLRKTLQNWRYDSFRAHKTSPTVKSIQMPIRHGQWTWRLSALHLSQAVYKRPPLC